MSDNVNHPSHYTSHPSGIECIEITKHHCFSIGNAIKYLWRAGLKNDGSTNESQDIAKAIWYINQRIDDIKADRLNLTLLSASQTIHASGHLINDITKHYQVATIRNALECLMQVGLSTIEHSMKELSLLGKAGWYLTEYSKYAERQAQFAKLNEKYAVEMAELKEKVLLSVTSAIEKHGMPLASADYSFDYGSFFDKVMNDEVIQTLAKFSDSEIYADGDERYTELYNLIDEFCAKEWRFSRVNELYFDPSIISCNDKNAMAKERLAVASKLRDTLGNSKMAYKLNYLQADFVQEHCPNFNIKNTDWNISDVQDFDTYSKDLFLDACYYILGEKSNSRTGFIFAEL